MPIYDSIPDTTEVIEDLRYSSYVQARLEPNGVKFNIAWT